MNLNENDKIFKKGLIAHMLLALLTQALYAESSGFNKPNIVFILSDDIGWNAMSLRADPEIPESGSLYYQTPNLDRLAESGIRFSQAYSPSAVCDPSRTSIQYGMTPTALAKFATVAPKTLPPVEDAMVSRLKAAHPEYRAAHFGKWHQRSRAPEDIGFDLSDGQTKNEQSKNKKDPKLTFSLAKKANRFIKEQAEAQTPFFLQVSFYANHLKFEALPETIAKYKKRTDQATEYHKSPVWAAMNEDLDSAIGSILNTLKEQGLLENTYIIYTADNGYEAKTYKNKSVDKRGFYKSYPLRAHKYVLNEGGIRVPFIVSGPGIPGGVSSRTPVVGYDIFPTVLDMVGAREQMPEAVEGGSLLPLCVSRGEESVKRRDPFMVFRSAMAKPAPGVFGGRLDVAIIQNGYKFYRELESGKEYLWSLDEDPGETNNLLKSMPEYADLLRKNMDNYCARVGWDQKERAPGNRVKGKK